MNEIDYLRNELKEWYSPRYLEDVQDTAMQLAHAEFIFSKSGLEKHIEYWEREVWGTLYNFTMDFKEEARIRKITPPIDSVPLVVSYVDFARYIFKKYIPNGG